MGSKEAMRQQKKTDQVAGDGKGPRDVYAIAELHGGCAVKLPDVASDSMQRASEDSL